MDSAPGEARPAGDAEGRRHHGRHEPGAGEDRRGGRRLRRDGPGEDPGGHPHGEGRGARLGPQDDQGRAGLAGGARSGSLESTLLICLGARRSMQMKRKLEWNLLSHLHVRTFWDRVGFGRFPSSLRDFGVFSFGTARC